MRTRRGGALLRLGWGIGDQALSSLTNLGVGILVARSLPTAQFGAFSLAFSVYLIVLGLVRAGVVEPLMIRAEPSGSSARATDASAVTGAALLLGFIAGVGSLAVVAIVGGSVGAAFLGLAVAFPGLILQDTWRYVFFAYGEGEKAFVNDLIWLIVMLPLFIWAGSDASVLGATLIWGGAGTIAGVFGLLQSRVLPRPAWTVQWLRRHRDLGSRFAAEEGILTVASQARLIGIGFVADLDAVGAYRAGQMVFGPMRVLYMGVRVIAVPEAVEARRRSQGSLMRICVLASASLALVALLVGVALLMLPDAWGQAILGQTWGPARELVVPMTLNQIGSGVLIGPLIGLRALEAASTSLRARAYISVATLAATVAGAAYGGAPAAAWSGATVFMFGSVFWWVLFRNALRSTENREGDVSEGGVDSGPRSR